MSVEVLMRPWLLALSFAVALSGQSTPDPGHNQQRIALGLISPDPLTQAWAAYRAGQDPEARHTIALRQLLVNAYRPEGSPEIHNAYRVIWAALDALIQTEADVPASELMPLLKGGFDGGVLYLLSRHPEWHTNHLLAEFTDESPIERWLAVGNLLLATRAPGLAARLLSKYRVEATVYLFSTDGVGEGGGASYGGGVACGGSSGNSDWPPLITHSLQLHPQRGDMLLADGPRPVYVRRRSTSRPLASLDRFQLRHEYLARLLGRSVQDTPLPPQSSLMVTWRGQVDYDHRLAAFRADLQSQFEFLRAELQRRDLLTSEEAAAARLMVTWQLHDHRPSPREELPYPQ